MVMRRGFSFIELVVSIVVIGIVFMSVPLIITETQRSTAFSMQQEGVMAGVTTMVDVLSHRWDEADTNQTLNGGFAKVCDVVSGPADLNRTSLDSNRRVGHFKGTYRRKFFDYTRLGENDPQGIRPGITFATPPADLGSEPSDGGVNNDIDDFNGTVYAIAGGGLRDYKYAYTAHVSVYYVTDDFAYDNAPRLATVSLPRSELDAMTNIKMVRVTLEGEEGNITLYGFSSNIGEYKILHRTF